MDNREGGALHCMALSYRLCGAGEHWALSYWLDTRWGDFSGAVESRTKAEEPVRPGVYTQASSLSLREVFEFAQKTGVWRTWPSQA